VQKWVKIGWGEYMKVGLVITPTVLLVALVGLI
jgi:arsenical pump membrane protein